MRRYALLTTAGGSSQAARWAHNPKVAGSNPAPAIDKIKGVWQSRHPLDCFWWRWGCRWMLAVPLNSSRSRTALPRQLSPRQSCSLTGQSPATNIVSLSPRSTLMTVHGMHREASIEIHASPEAVYDLVSDLPRMGEWSPENIGGEWQGGGSGKVGDRFIGRNRAGERTWAVPVLVTRAERGRCFEFVTRPDEGP